MARTPQFVRRLSYPTALQARRLEVAQAVGAGPHVDNAQPVRILGLDREDQAPPLRYPKLLNLQTCEGIVEETVLLEQTEAPVGLIPPVVVLLQLYRCPRPRLCGWSQSLRIYPADVKTWRFCIGDVRNLCLPPVEPLAPRNDETGVLSRVTLR